MRGRTIVSKSLILLGLCAQFGCRQMAVSKHERADGVDGTFEPESARDGLVPIEKELAAPQGFFSKTREPFGGWSGQARDIEKSLGVNR